MKNNLITIKNDLYHIAEELRRIDSRYRLKYNPNTGKYQLHNRERGDKLMLVYPFDKLDYRAVEYTLKTRWQRIRALLAELAEHDTKLNKQAKKKAQEQIQEKLEGYKERI